MAITNAVFDLQAFYKSTFGTQPYVLNVPDKYKKDTLKKGNGSFDTLPAKSTPQSRYNSVLLEDYLGVEIWLPVWFRDLPQDYFTHIEDCEIVDANKRELHLPYCTVRITARKDIIKTPVNARQGTVKEVYNIDDYQITLRGFLIDKINYSLPEMQMVALRRLFELGQSVAIDNALTNLFLVKMDMPNQLDPGNNTDNVAIETLDFEEVRGCRKNMRAFTMQMISDNINSLFWANPKELNNTNEVVMGSSLIQTNTV